MNNEVKQYIAFLVIQKFSLEETIENVRQERGENVASRAEITDLWQEISEWYKKEQERESMDEWWAKVAKALKERGVI